MSKKQKTYEVPDIVWLKMTDYMHGWLQWELGGEARVGEQKVICVQDLDGGRDVLRMETWDDIMDDLPLSGNAMSCTRYNVYKEGLIIDAEAMDKKFGVTKEVMKLFVPIECSNKLRLTKNGVLRAWTLDSCFGKEQATALQRLLKGEFWKAVEEFDEKYALQMEKTDNKNYPAREMVEAFCEATKTPDYHVEAIRREWQRRQKRVCP